jgi:hypothetical protein
MTEIEAVSEAAELVEEMMMDLEMPIKKGVVSGTQRLYDVLPVESPFLVALVHCQKRLTRSSRLLGIMKEIFRKIDHSGDGFRPGKLIDNH